MKPQINRDLDIGQLDLPDNLTRRPPKCYCSPRKHLLITGIIVSIILISSLAWLVSMLTNLPSGCLLVDKGLKVCGTDGITYLSIENLICEARRHPYTGPRLAYNGICLVYPPGQLYLIIAATGRPITTTISPTRIFRNTVKSTWSQLKTTTDRFDYSSGFFYKSRFNRTGWNNYISNHQNVGQFWIGTNKRQRNKPKRKYQQTINY
ncbi:hypothetical protein CHUAL_010572 [Chamberlinius hualienensis]